MSVAHPVFVLHEHHLPQHHFDLRLEEDGDALLHLVQEQPDANGGSLHREPCGQCPSPPFGGTAVEGVLGRPVDLIAERLQEAAELLADGWSEESGLSGALAANCAANCR